MARPGRPSVEAALRERVDRCRVAVVEEHDFAAVHGGDAGHLVVGRVRNRRHRSFRACARGRTDFWTTTMPRWMSQRNTTCATDFPWAVPISVSVGSVNRLLRPSANGPHDSICTPRSRMSSCSACAGRRDGISIWSTAGVDLVVIDEIDESVGVEVRDTDRASEALNVVLFFHRSPRAVVVAEGWWMRYRST